MITPTVGRIVWYWHGGGQQQPWAAIVTFVHSDTMVNLALFDENGVGRQKTSVLLLQENEDGVLPDIDEELSYCEWMPYQKGQAAKTEALKKQLLGNDPNK